MSAPVLYSFRRCPYAMRARMAIAASGVAVRLREILLRDKPAQMLEISPKGTVPVLQLSDGAVIDESLDVMHWALAQSDPQGWGALSQDDLGVMNDLIAENDGPFKADLDRYKYATRYEDADPEAHRAGGFAFLQKLEARLSASPFLFGVQRRLGDVAIFPFVRQFRIADEAWFDAQPIPHVQTWLAEHLNWSVFQAVMAKYPLWKETGEEIAFPNC